MSPHPPSSMMLDSSLIEKGHNDLKIMTKPISNHLEPHASSLKGALYFLSFAPPVPSFLRDPKGFITHPYSLYVIGLISACIFAGVMPADFVILGTYFQRLTNPEYSDHQVAGYAIETTYLIMTVTGVCVITYASMSICLTIAGVKLASGLRERYFAAMIVQDQSFHDRIGPGELATKVGKDVDIIRDGLSTDLGFLVWDIVQIVIYIILAFTRGNAKFAAVCFSPLPMLLLVRLYLWKWVKKQDEHCKPIENYKASLMEQILSSMRVVASFGVGETLLQKCEEKVMGDLRHNWQRKAWAHGFDDALAFTVTCLMDALCYWYGEKLKSEGFLTTSEFIISFFNAIQTFWVYMELIPHMNSVIQGSRHLQHLREDIDTQPTIDARDASGIKLGPRDPASFTLENVTFAYPTRPTVPVLQNVSLTIPQGKFIAIVGPSGGGKSILAGLLLRLYDPQPRGSGEHARLGGGRVLFGNHDLRDINLHSLRSQLAVVLQNPQLLAGSVLDNVAAGLEGSDIMLQSNASQRRGVHSRESKVRLKCEEALRKAQAWEFVSALPNGMDEVIEGGRTSVLSGGQVARIGLARALVSQARCVILDEATAAVATDSERKIQECLEEELKRGMTMIVIAHRLSTIMKADEIVVMDKGKVVQQGTYASLMDINISPNDTFRHMVSANSFLKEDTLAADPETSSAPSKPPSTLILSSVDTPPAQHLENITRPILVVCTMKWMFGLGTVTSVLRGLSRMSMFFLVSRAFGVFVKPDLVLGELQKYEIVFAAIGVPVGIICIVSTYLMEMCGNEATVQLERHSMTALMKQEMGFFESEEGRAGGMTSQVSSMASSCGYWLGSLQPHVLSCLTGLIGAPIIGFFFSWRWTVVTVPLIALLVYTCTRSCQLGMKLDDSMASKSKREGDYMAEACNSVLLLRALRRESTACQQFSQVTQTALPIAQLTIAKVIGGLVHAAGAIYMGTTAYYFYYLLKIKNETFSRTVTASNTLVFAIISAILMSSHVNSISKGLASMKTLKGWLNRQPKISPSVYQTVQAEEGAVVTFSDVQLRYPSRPDTLALNGISFNMYPKHYAFVGTSGAGKSSIINLLERFYEPTAGAILLDGVDIRNIEIDTLRANIGLVSQEAVLFEGSIRYNVSLGAKDPSTVSDEEILWAIEQACMLDFVQQVPGGLDAQLGMKGVRLSGGQKQRLCIARAILRQPRILLLDEATSALDNHSEKVVQNAIENASKGRLTISIAHRLSTIRNADCIMVMESGKIVENGTHEELLAIKGRYLELVQAQL